MNDSLDVAKCEGNLLFLNIAQAFLLFRRSFRETVAFGDGRGKRGMWPGPSIGSCGVVSQVSTCINCLTQTFG
jgi:hypothetical protein